MGYVTDREWSDEYIPTIKKIVGEYVLTESPLEVDCQEATDLIVFDARSLKIACRLRRPGYFEKYGNEFTIRCHRENGVTTELEKVVNGFGDWFFYGHADNGNTLNITNWMLINLDSFRAHLIRNQENIVFGNKDNHDGTWFKWYDVHSFKGLPPILIASSFIQIDKLVA